MLIKLGGQHISERCENILKIASSWLRTVENVTEGCQPEYMKYAAVLVLKEIYLYAPAVAFSHIISGGKETLKDLLATVREPKKEVRKAAFELIKTLLKLINNKEDTIKKELYMQIYYKAKADIASLDITALQGSLLIIDALLTYSPQENFGEDQFIEICENVFKCKDNKNIEIKKTILALIPKIAAFSTGTFVNKYLPLSMQFIVDFITKKARTERGEGFLTFGQLCKIMSKENFGSQISMVWKLVEDEVIKNKANFCPEVLDCVQMACSIYGAEFLKNVNVHVFIDNLFYSGLNEKLIAALKQIMAIPDCEKELLISIKIRLLNAISVILTRKKFKFSGYLSKKKLVSPIAPISNAIPKFTELPPVKKGLNNNTENSIPASLKTSEGEVPRPNLLLHEESKENELNTSKRKKSKCDNDSAKLRDNLTSPLLEREVAKLALSKETIKKYSQKVVEAVKENFGDLSVLKENRREEIIILALRSLSYFDFPEFSECLAQFVLDNVLGYFDDENSDIRKVAIKASWCLFDKDDKTVYFEKLDRVNKIVYQFLIASINELDPKISCKILKYLNYKWDRALSQTYNINLLFQCAQISFFEVRNEAIKILGRISSLNPSLIQPFFRKQLLQQLSIFECSKDLKEKEESVQSLGAIIKYFGEMCKTNTQLILNYFLPKLKDPTHSLLIPSIISIFGPLSEVGSENMKPILCEIIPIIIDIIKDHNNGSKREIAINTLSQIAENTNYAIYPYIHYPYLFKCICNLILQETSQSIRKCVLRLLGTIGALDPYKFKQIMLYASISEAQDSDIYEGSYQIYESLIEDSKNAGHGIRSPNFNKNERYKNVGEIDKTLVQDPNNLIAVKTDLLKQLQGFSKFENISQFSETYYQTAAIKALVGVLLIPSLKDHHPTVLQSLKVILKSLTSDFIPYLPIIIPPVLNIMKTGESSMISSIFEFLSQLVWIIGESFAEYCRDIFIIIYQFLEQKKEVSYVLELIELMSRYTRSAFKSELSSLLPKLLTILYESKIRPKDHIIRILNTLKEFGEQLDDHLNLVMLALINFFCSCEIGSANLEFKLGVLAVIKSIVKCPHFKDYISCLVHPLAKQIEPSTYSVYGSKITSLFIFILNMLNINFAIYLPLIQRTIMKHKILKYEFCGASGKYLKQNYVDIFF